MTASRAPDAKTLKFGSPALVPGTHAPGTNPCSVVSGLAGLRASGPLTRIIEHINEHLQDELSLVELSRIAKLSPHHFATAFKVSTGISPHRYVIERRINRARDLLLRKEKTISEIAGRRRVLEPEPPNGEFPPEDGSDAAEVSPVPGLNQHMFVLGENAGVAFRTPLVPDLNPSAERLVLRRPDV